MRSFLDRGRARARRLSSLALLLAAGCEGYGSEYPTGPAERPLVVHAMLAAGAPEQQVLVEYARNVDEGMFRGLTPASGARVRVTGPAEHAFTEDPARPGVYRASFTPAAGAEYQLRIDGPAGERVTGRARVPHAPRLALPRADTTISLGQYLTVAWNPVQSAAAYVLVERSADQPVSVITLASPPVVADTSFTSQWGALGRTLFPVRVAAVDQNFARYLLGEGEGPSGRGRLQRTVEGGYGLFGAYAVSDVRVIRVR